MLTLHATERPCQVPPQIYDMINGYAHNDLISNFDADIKIYSNQNDNEEEFEISRMQFKILWIQRIVVSY